MAQRDPGQLRLGVVAATVMMVICLTSSARADQPPKADSPLRLGLSYGDTLVWLTDRQLADTLDDAVDMGVGWVRADLSWNNIQPRSAAEYQWDRFDRLVAETELRGLELLPIITYTPPWARPAGCVTEKCRPASAEQFATFAGRAAARYPNVNTWEIWNEQNFPLFWQPRPDPVAYGQLLRLTMASLRESNPSAQVIIGGMANTNASEGGISPQDFLTVLVQSGATAGVDGVGVHPYTYPYLPSESGPWMSPGGDVDVDLDSLRGVFVEAGSPALPIWITETGAPTGGSGDDHVTEERQAEIATDAVRTAAADNGVAALIWYTYHDTGDDPDDPESHYGLLRGDFSEKPGYGAFRQAIADAARWRAGTD